MKTAEQWTEEQTIPDGDDKCVYLEPEPFLQLVKQIQLDAYKQGMLDSAEICNDGVTMFKRLTSNKGAIIACESCRDNILANEKVKKSI